MSSKRQLVLCRLVWLLLASLPCMGVGDIRSEQAVVVARIGNPGGIRIVFQLTGDSAKLNFCNDKVRSVNACC